MARCQCPVRMQSYTDGEIKVLVGTWNVGNAMPPSDLDPWVPLGGGDFDVIALGVQESNYEAGGIGEITRFVRSLTAKDKGRSHGGFALRVQREYRPFLLHYSPRARPQTFGVSLVCPFQIVPSITRVPGFTRGKQKEWIGFSRRNR